MTTADEPCGPSGRVVLLLAVTVLPISIGLLWIGTMHLDGTPAFLVKMLAFTLALGAGMGPTLFHGFRARRRQRIEQPKGPEGGA